MRRQSLVVALLTGWAVLFLAPAQARAIDEVVCSADGAVVAASDRHVGKVWIWELPSGKLLRTLDAAPMAMAVSPDGKRLAFSRAELLGESLVFYDIAEGKETATLQPDLDHSGVDRRLVFSPDGKRLLGINRVTRNIGLYEVDPPRDVSADCKGPMGPAVALAFSEEGRPLAVEGLAGSDDGVVEIDTGKVLSRFVLERDYQNDWVDAFFPQGEVVVLLRRCGSSDTLRLYDPRTGKETTAISCDPDFHRIGCAALSPDGKLFAWTGVGGAVHLWNRQARKEIGVIPADWSPGTSIVFSPDAKSILVAELQDGGGLRHVQLATRSERVLKESDRAKEVARKEKQRAEERELAIRYPQEETLNALFAEIVKAAKAADRKKLDELCAGLFLPDPSSFFRLVGDRGAAMAASYEKHKLSSQTHLATTFANAVLAEGDTEVHCLQLKAERGEGEWFTTDLVMKKLMKEHKVAFWTIVLSKPGNDWTKRLTPGHLWEDSFVKIDGKWRYYYTPKEE